jgi:glutaredoxin
VYQASLPHSRGLSHLPFPPTCVLLSCSSQEPFFQPTFAEIEKQKEAAKKQEEESNKEVPKTDKPKVDLFVMSFCPYGNKSEDTLKSVYALLKNKVEFNFHYIVTVEGDKVQSLHGEKEVAQNEREACVLKDYGKDKWFDFVAYVNKNCGSDGACWEAGAKILGINSVKVSACVAADGLALMKANAEISDQAGATGSPTLMINGFF